eukprot:EC721519.1.p1 GENE.EC721519.1~~EC721519.1.p1  ORF type:complete len:82 (+),score=1.96 EC721519.1:31-276(+)
MFTAVGLVAKNKIPDLARWARYLGLGVSGALAGLGLLGIILSVAGPKIAGLWAAIYSMYSLKMFVFWFNNSQYCCTYFLLD